MNFWKIQKKLKDEKKENNLRLNYNKWWFVMKTLAKMIIFTLVSELH